MPEKQAQYLIEKRKAIGENRALPEPDQEMSCRKSITTLQICARCGGRFPFKKGRKQCPICEGLLRTKTTVLKDRPSSTLQNTYFPNFLISSQE
jgi:hypothetical protein